MNVDPSPLATAQPAGAEADARQRILDAALALFAEHGFDGASVRAIADVASVSAGLIIHYFGTKEALRVAVDESVIAEFRAAVSRADGDAVARGSLLASATWGRALGDVILASPHLRAYMRRALLDGSESGQMVLDHLFEETQRGIDSLATTGALRADLDRDWLPFQLLFVVLGPLLFESFIQRRVQAPAFTDEMVDRRSAASYDLLSRGFRRTT